MIFYLRYLVVSDEERVAILRLFFWYVLNVNDDIVKKKLYYVVNW